MSMRSTTTRGLRSGRARAVTLAVAGVAVAGALGGCGAAHRFTDVPLPAPTQTSASAMPSLAASTPARLTPACRLITAAEVSTAVGATYPAGKDSSGGDVSICSFAGLPTVVVETGPSIGSFDGTVQSATTLFAGSAKQQKVSLAGADQATVVSGTLSTGGLQAAALVYAKGSVFVQILVTDDKSAVRHAEAIAAITVRR